jgi:hypothetical protein
LIENIVPERETIEPRSGSRLPVDWTTGDGAQCAQDTHQAGNDTNQVLVAIEDVTGCGETRARARAARERIAALLQELGHRIKNSLQIIVSMVNLEAEPQEMAEGGAGGSRIASPPSGASIPC